MKGEGKSRTCVNSVCDTVMSIYGLAIVGGMVAMGIHLFGTGLTFIPNAVLAITGSLFVIALLVAIKTRQFKGLQVGLPMLAAAVLTLGSHQMLGNESSVGLPGQIAASMFNVLCHSFPIIAGVVAIAGAFAFNDQKAEPKTAVRVEPRGNWPW